MKSIQEWLYELPEPYRRVALRYHSNYSKMGKADCLANALVLGFKWSSSEEGREYWSKVHEMCISGKFAKEPTPRRTYYKPKEKKSIKAQFIKSNEYAGVKIKKKPFQPKTDIKMIKEVESILMAKYYPDLDSALEDFYKPINKQTKN